MAQSVDKLKELLFQPESDAIAALSKRIESVFQHAGTTERFRASVADVLDGALRDAEVARHDQLAEAIAPVVVSTIKTEIRGSTDELVEALYPATGRMVRAYVASAIKDLTDQINERLEKNPVVSRLAGSSAAEVAIAESQRLKIEDVFLIRRATGELIARFPEGTEKSNHDHVLGGVLTAINEFTSEAFKAEGSALRQIDLGESRVYLRVSPSYLLAARCHGIAPIGSEGVFDDEFLSLMGRLQTAERNGSKDASASAAQTALVQGLAKKLESRLGTLAAVHRVPRRGIKPVYLLLGLILTGIAAWAAWAGYASFKVARVREAASAVIAQDPDMLGYPARITVAADAKSLKLSGLTPSYDAKTRIVTQLKAALPDVTVNDELNTVPVGLTDVGPALNEFERILGAKSERRNVERAILSLERTGQLLDQAVSSGVPRYKVGKLATEATDVAAALRATRAAPADIGPLAVRTEALTSAIEALTPAVGNAPPAAALDPGGTTQGEHLALVAERTVNAARALIELDSMQRRIDAMKADIAALPHPKATTAREDLTAFTRSNAVFFSDATAFKDEAATTTTLKALAAILARDKDLLVRIVGYTDEIGAPASNTTLADSRAAAVASALEGFGVRKNQLVQLHRTSPEYNLSPTKGTGSPNRRVEFEVGFVGESQP